MKRNRHSAETFYVCIFFFFYFPFISLLFYWFLDAIVAEKHLVVSKLVFQPFLCSSSLFFFIFGWDLAFCVLFRLRFLLFSMFVLSVCLQMHPMGLVFTCSAYFFIGAFFVFSGWLDIASSIVIIAETLLPWSSSNTRTFSFCFFLFFRVGVSRIFVYAGKTAFVCICVSWVCNPISPTAVCCGQVFQESEAPWCSCLRLFFVLFCWRVFASFSPKFAFLSCSNALFPLLSLANDDEFARKSWTDDANINVADSNGSVVWISPHFLIYLFGSSVFVFICICCHSVAFLSFFAWFGWQFVQEKIRCFSFVFLFSLVCLFVRIHPHPLSNMHM